jgi:type VI secretion system protein ImpA
MIPPFPETIWSPIGPGRPGGDDLAFAPELDEIRAARQGDDPDLAQGAWARSPRPPQWARVRGLCEAILGGRSKDLQVACWYAEALAHTGGFAGLAHGLRTMEVLLDRFWTTCHPALTEAGGPGPDWEERAGRIEWLDRNGCAAVGRIPLTVPAAGGHGLLAWRESRRVDNLGLRSAAAQEEAIREGRLTGEAFGKAAAASGAGHFRRLASEIRAAAEACATLQATVDRRFVPDPPGLAALAEAIQACGEVAGQCLGRFGPGPEPPQPGPPPAEAREPAGAVPAEPSGPSGAAAAQAPDGTPEPAAGGAPGRTRTDAIRELRELAGWFQAREPHSPVPALLDRAADWAEMPLARWLGTVVKDPATLAQLRELLALDR